MHISIELEHWKTWNSLDTLMLKHCCRDTYIVNDIQWNRS